MLLSPLLSPWSTRPPVRRAPHHPPWLSPSSPPSSSSSPRAAILSSLINRRPSNHPKQEGQERRDGLLLVVDVLVRAVRVAAPVVLVDLDDPVDAPVKAAGTIDVPSVAVAGIGHLLALAVLAAEVDELFPDAHGGRLVVVVGGAWEVVEEDVCG